jgi:hypothetical protein
LAYPFREQKTHLTFDDLINGLRELMRRFPDKRTGSNIKYSMEDVASAAFSVFFTQSPSFLAYQSAMTESHGNSNAQTLFGMRSIPTDNHIRDLLDAVPPQQVFPMFERIFTALHEQGHLQALQTFDGQLLIALDGTQYHQSNSIRCKHCTVTKRSNKQISYAHAGDHASDCRARPQPRIAFETRVYHATGWSRKTGLRECCRQALD